MQKSEKSGRIVVFVDALSRRKVQAGPVPVASVNTSDTRTAVSRARAMHVRWQLSGSGYGGETVEKIVIVLSTYSISHSVWFVRRSVHPSVRPSDRPSVRPPVRPSARPPCVSFYHFK